MSERKSRATARIVGLTSPSMLERTSGKVPVNLRITYKRRSKFYGMAISCLPDQWNKEKGRFRKNFPEYTVENEILAKQEEKARSIIRQIELDDMEFTFQEFIKRYRGKGDFANVLEFFNKIIKEFEDMGKISTALPYRNTLSAILSFSDKGKAYSAKELRFKDIDYKFLMEFEHYMLVDRENSSTTASIYMRHLRAAYNRAIKEKVAKREQYPFEDYSIHKRLKPGAKRIVLSKAQISEMESLSFDNGSYIQLARDLFLFSYYCRGMNFADMILLNPSNFIETDSGQVVMKYTRQKTGHKFEIGLPKKALAIYQKYFERISSPKDFLFPIYKREVHTGGQKTLDRKKTALKRINKHLKTIGTLLGVEGKLTTYSARHSFATNALHSGASKEVLQDSLGHQSITTTETYTRSLPSEILDQEINKFFD